VNEDSHSQFLLLAPASVNAQDGMGVLGSVIHTYAEILAIISYFHDELGRRALLKTCEFIEYSSNSASLICGSGKESYAPKERFPLPETGDSKRCLWGS
jgi:hypothetical protein